MGMQELVFWASFAFVIYVYIGYPLVLMAWKLLAARPVRKTSGEPLVTLVVAASNDRAGIRRKIENCLSLDYPLNRLEILVSLEGPTDGTEILMFKFAGQGVHLVYTPDHIGKATAINRAVEKASGDILVFVDAGHTLDRSAIRDLTANFGDPDVGAAFGELAQDGLGLYWRYEKFICTRESAIHSAIGVTGAVYAVRKSLFRKLAEETILDDVATSMVCLLAGRRVVFDSTARAFDQTVSSPELEYRRKIQTSSGNFQLLADMPDLLLPWSNPVFLQFFSHKVARLFVPYALMMLAASNMLLLRGGYLAFFAFQAAWYGAAILGGIASRTQKQAAGMVSRHWRPVMKQIALIPYTFLLLNWVAVVGLFHFLQDSRDSVSKGKKTPGTETAIESFRRPAA